MEQLVARRAHNPKVAGSSPVPATKKNPIQCESDFLFIVNRNIADKRMVAGVVGAMPVCSPGVSKLVFLMFVLQLIKTCCF